MSKGSAQRPACKFPQEVSADGGNYWLPPWEYLEMFLQQ